MRQFIRDHFARAVAILVVLATLLGGVAVLIPNIRAVLIDHPAWGWGAALAFGCAAIYIWMLYDREAELVASNRRSHEIKLNDVVGDATQKQSTAHQIEMHELQGELIKAREDSATAESAAVQLAATIADLRRRLGPSSRDIAQYSLVRSVVPLEGGTMPWLRDSFSGKRWRDDQVAPLHTVDIDWQEWFFDDAAVDDTFRRFRLAVARLLSWMAIEGGRDRNLEFAGEGHSIYSIADGSAPHRTWPEFDAERDVGTGLADQVVAARRELERAARDARLDQE